MFSLQANAGNPVEPTPTLTSDLALEDFEVQFWDGAEWLGVPGGRVVGNLLVWSRVVFPAITTSSIRILVTQVAAGRSRLAEVEVYTMATLPPTVTLTAPTEGTDFQAPAMITLSADADDPDGTVTEVEFYANGTLVGSAESPTFTAVWSNVPDGTHSLTARAIDDSLAEATSIPVTVVVTQGGNFNVAAAANGATATASSTYSASYPPSAANNGDRSGQGWGAGGVWQDSGPALPDWLQIDFDQAHTISQVDVFSLQQNAGNPVEPTPTLTSSLAVQDFHLEHWDGAQWTIVPESSVAGNTLVWAHVTFPAITATRVRLVITRAPANRSRIAELEISGVP